MHANLKLLDQVLNISLLKLHLIFVLFILGFWIWTCHFWSNIKISLCFDFCSSKSVWFKCVCYLILCDWYSSVIALNLIIQAGELEYYFKKLNTFQIYQILRICLHFLWAWMEQLLVCFGDTPTFALCLKDRKSKPLLGYLNFWMNVNLGVEVKAY